MDGAGAISEPRRASHAGLYLKAKTNYGEDGTLLAANSDEDAARVQQLVAVCETVVVESGHDIHYERPKTFADAVDRAASVASAK